MKKAQAEPKQLLLMFEIIVIVIVILAFYTTVQGDKPLNFQDVDRGLTKEALTYAQGQVENINTIDSLPKSKKKGDVS